jgi:hypothetical protein
MNEVELFIKSLYDVKLALGLVTFLSVMAYQVRVHHKVLFGPGGELNFVTTAEKNKIVREERSNQEKENKRMGERISDACNEECAVHKMSMEIVAETKNQQNLNVQKLILLEEALKESRLSREETNKKLSKICLDINTSLINQEYFKTDLDYLKRRVDELQKS